jgi:hypothetical protein
MQLGADVVAVADGTRTLKDAINACLRDGAESMADTHYFLGTVCGPPRRDPGGTTWRAYLDLAARAATRFSLPSVFMGYYNNSVFGMGAERFWASLPETGMPWGVHPPDLPPDEAAELNPVARWREIGPQHDPEELAGPGRDRPPSVGLRLLRHVMGRDRAEDRPLAGAWQRSWRDAARVRRCRSGSGSGRPPTYERCAAWLTLPSSAWQVSSAS